MSRDAAGFWQAFVGQAERFAGVFLAGDRRTAFDEIDGMLQRFGFDVCFDLTRDGEAILLIFSPEGDPGMAEVIDRLVSLAPPLPAWRLMARRPAKPLKDVRAIVWNLYRIDLLRCGFEIAGPRFLRLSLPEDSDLSPEERGGLCNTLLWHSFGEDRVMKERFRCEIGQPSAAGGSMLSFSEAVEKMAGA